MRALIATTLFGAALSLSSLGAQPAPDKPPPDKDKKAASLEGAYTIVSGERDGKAIPEAEIKGSVVRFAYGKLVATDKDRKEFFATTYVVDAAKTPWKIDLKNEAPTKGTPGDTAPKEAVTAAGLVKKEGESLTLIYALPGGEAPTEFKTKAKQQMFVLKNVAAEPPTEDNKFKKGP